MSLSPSSHQLPIASQLGVGARELPLHLECSLANSRAWSTAVVTHKRCGHAMLRSKLFTASLHTPTQASASFLPPYVIVPGPW